MKTLLLVIFLKFIVVIHTKNSYFQLFSNKDQFSQVSFQTDNNGYIMKNFNNGTTTFYDFQSTEALLEMINLNNYLEINFMKPLTLYAENIDLTMNYNNSDINYEKLNQFYLFYSDDFQSNSKGWSNDATSVCGTNNNNFLGGPCKFSDTITEKTYNEIPPHKEIRITATFHFFDDWAGEEAYMLVNDTPIWSDSYSWCPGVIIWLCKKKSINVCGNEKSDRLGVPIDVTFRHTDSFFKLLFKTSLKKDACQASWGVDNINIYIR